MALVGRVEMGTHLMTAALAAVPEVVLDAEVVRQVADDRVKMVCWAMDGDLDAFDGALDADPTVTSHAVLTELEDRRLYRITLVEESDGGWVYPVFVENDIVVLQSTVTAETQTVLARFPSRDAVVALRDACERRDIPFRLAHLYREERAANDGGVDGRYGLTGPQRDALLHALESGYFDVPRRTKLQSMAEELGVSTQALSTRLRRAQTNLLRNTVAREPDV